MSSCGYGHRSRHRPHPGSQDLRRRKRHKQRQRGRPEVRADDDVVIAVAVNVAAGIDGLPSHSELAAAEAVASCSIEEIHVECAVGRAIGSIECGKVRRATKYQIGITGIGDRERIRERIADQNVANTVAVDIACGSDGEPELVTIIGRYEAIARRPIDSREVDTPIGGRGICSVQRGQVGGAAEDKIGFSESRRRGLISACDDVEMPSPLTSRIPSTRKPAALPRTKPEAGNPRAAVQIRNGDRTIRRAIGSVESSKIGCATKDERGLATICGAGLVGKMSANENIENAIAVNVAGRVDIDTRRSPDARPVNL